MQVKKNYVAQVHTIVQASHHGYKNSSPLHYDACQPYSVSPLSSEYLCRRIKMSYYQHYQAPINGDYVSPYSLTNMTNAPTLHSMQVAHVKVKRFHTNPRSRTSLLTTLHPPPRLTVVPNSRTSEASNLEDNTSSLKIPSRRRRAF